LGALDGGIPRKASPLLRDFSSATCAGPGIAGWRLGEGPPEADRIRIKVRFDIEDEAEQFALSFGGDLEVIEPAETIVRRAPPERETC
jgi:hypothetical protein